MEKIKIGQEVYVIKYKYNSNKKLFYYIDKMICSGFHGRYIYCRSLENANKKYSTCYEYAQTYSKYQNRVFANEREAIKNMAFRQKEYNLKKKYEQKIKEELRKGE